MRIAKGVKGLVFFSLCCFHGLAVCICQCIRPTVQKTTLPVKHSWLSDRASPRKKQQAPKTTTRCWKTTQCPQIACKPMFCVCVVLTAWPVWHLSSKNSYEELIVKREHMENQIHSEPAKVEQFEYFWYVAKIYLKMYVIQRIRICDIDLW